MIGVARADCGAFGLAFVGIALVWDCMAGIAVGTTGVPVAGIGVDCGAFGLAFVGIALV